MTTNEEYHSGDFHEISFMDQNGELKTTKIPVVQELARLSLTNGHFPKNFIAFKPSTTPENDDLNTLVVTPPVIDIAKLQDDATRESELKRLADAVKEWGTFLITNHGLEDSVFRAGSGLSVLDDAKDAIKGFFALSFEEKKASVGSYKSVDNMGYGKSFVKSEDQLLDWCDRLTMKAAPVEEETNGLRIWPKNPANFRQVIETYVEKSRKVLDKLLQDLAASLSLEENAFLQYFEPKESELKVRVNYYPPCPRPDLAIGIMPHSDASGLTLLLEFGATSGLQVLKDEVWTTLQWPADSTNLLVNIGDLMEIISNGVFKSPWHRVRAKPDVERFSLAYFYNPPAKSEIGPEAGADAEVTYKKVMVDDYVSNFYKISPRPNKESINYAKLA